MFSLHARVPQPAVGSPLWLCTTRYEVCLESRLSIQLSLTLGLPLAECPHPDADGEVWYRS